MRNKFDRTGQCLKDGLAAEDVFLKLATNKGYKAEPSNRSDQLKHVDVWLENKDTIRHGVDVKASKRLSRGGETQDELCWIEIRGVRKNGSSWLVNGIAKFIAFERADSFILVDRLELLELVCKICDLKTFVSYSGDALYKSYRRKERPDEHLTIIKFDDLKKIKHFVWDKVAEKV